MRTESAHEGSTKSSPGLTSRKFACIQLELIPHWTWQQPPPHLALPLRQQPSGSYRNARSTDTQVRHSNSYYSPHAHDELSAHLVLEGEMTVLFHDEKEAGKRSYGPGERVDIGIGRLHEVWIGKDGCVSVIGR